MNRFLEILLLAAVPGLMFCVDLWGGMPFRLSWQLAALWAGGAAFTFLLSSWWWKVFFLLALGRTATINPPHADAYLSLVTIAVFLAGAEGFNRIDKEKTMDAMAVAALILVLWILGQACGALPAFFAPRHAGPFNPNSGGVVLGLCSIALLRFKWSWLFPGLAWSIWMTETSTGFLAAAAGVSAYTWVAMKGTMKIAVFALVVLAALGWFWKADPIDRVTDDVRLIAWHHGMRAVNSDPMGRGLGSWKDIFPLFASGDRRVGVIEVEPGRLVMSNYFREAHNEYVQAAFELGLQTFLLIICFTVWVFVIVLFGKIDAHAAGGMTALLVACCGWHLFHVGPDAVIGVAWLGMWEAAGLRFRNGE